MNVKDWDWAWRKSNQATRTYVIETMGRSATESLFLDDNKLNVKAAKRAGMKAAQVRGAEEAEEVLSESRILEDPGEGEET
jgi:FMN phosphatase YigB (HAD superfamily)